MNGFIRTAIVVAASALVATGVAGCSSGSGAGCGEPPGESALRPSSFASG